MTLKQKTALVFAATTMQTSDTAFSVLVPLIIAKRLTSMMCGEKVKLFEKDLVLIILDEKNINRLFSQDEFLNDFGNALGNKSSIHCIITNEHGKACFQKFFDEHTAMYIHEQRPDDCCCLIDQFKKVNLN